MQSACRGVAAVVALACLTAAAGRSAAAELWSDASGDRSYSLDTSVKWTSVLSRADSDSVLYPEEWSAISLWRLRAVLDARPIQWLGAQVAYEQQARLQSQGAGAAGAPAGLPAGIATPYRVRQLDSSIAEVEGSLSVRHELDRAFVAVSLGRAELIVGRQAVGWGRGVYFSAVDVFVPFSPLESDREWRPGVDAVRLSVPVAGNVSVDAVAAFGESADESAFLGRLRGYAGDVDAELILGRRREDDVYAVSVSLPVLEAELHGELAGFATDEPFPSDISGDDTFVMKAVAGGSYSFDVAAGLYVVVEYHYSGFGLTDVGDAALGLDDSAAIERYLWGDTQILGRHAAALHVTYGVGTVFPASLTWIASPADGSGIVSPSVTWVFSDNVTLTASGYVPHGCSSADGELRSEYGAVPAGGLLQLSFYY